MRVRWLRRTLMLVAAFGSLTCAHARVQRPTPPDKYLLPLVPDDAIVCIQQSEHRASCIRADDLRALLAVLGRA